MLHCTSVLSRGQWHQIPVKPPPQRCHLLTGSTVWRKCPAALDTFLCVMVSKIVSHICQQTQTLSFVVCGSLWSFFKIYLTWFNKCVTNVTVKIQDDKVFYVLYVIQSMLCIILYSYLRGGSGLLHYHIVAMAFQTLSRGKPWMTKRWWEEWSSPIHWDSI